MVSLEDIMVVRFQIQSLRESYSRQRRARLAKHAVPLADFENTVPHWHETEPELPSVVNEHWPFVRRKVEEG